MDDAIFVDVRLPWRNSRQTHVKAHSSGGENIADNFLPACRLCNNYRWHYDADEIKWILKLGVWTRWQILHNTVSGKLIAEGFIKKENAREKRRRYPRSSFSENRS
jgi:hypothetical protein